MERQSKGPRDLEAYCSGGQGQPQAVAPTDDDGDSFPLEAESTPRPYCGRKDYFSKKIPMTPSGI